MAENLKRHARDAVSLVMGLVLVSIAAVFLATDISDRDVDLRWVAPAVLIGIGATGLAASVRRREPR